LFFALSKRTFAMSKTFKVKDLNVNHKNGGGKCRTLMLRINQ